MFQEYHLSPRDRWWLFTHLAEGSIVDRNVLPPFPPTPPGCNLPSQPGLAGYIASKKNKKKIRRQRETKLEATEPDERDVLFGREPSSVNHPGNVKFRLRALDLRPIYELSSKEENKQRIADSLVKYLTDGGDRFLEKGDDGQWHEVIYGARRKASQALRERMMLV